jgi:hypothetical protein
METFSSIGFVLLLMVAYSLGAVLSSRGKGSPSPGWYDLGAVLILIIVAFRFGEWSAIVIWFPGVGLASGLIGLFREIGAMEKSSVEVIGPWWRRWWEGWKILAAKIGNFQGRLLLGFFYFLVITPWGVLMRLFGDPLRTKSRPTSSFWVDRSGEPPEIEGARRQY